MLPQGEKTYMWRIKATCGMKHLNITWNKSRAIVNLFLDTGKLKLHTTVFDNRDSLNEWAFFVCQSAFYICVSAHNCVHFTSIAVHKCA